MPLSFVELFLAAASCGEFVAVPPALPLPLTVGVFAAV